jgi:methylmalonyl-CoA mutase
MLAAGGARPRVFLANLGTPADFTPRATFARNFFEAGGIEAVSHEGAADQAALAESFRASGARLVCLCSADEVYAREAIPAAKAIASAGAAHIYLAGKPRDQADALAQAGIGTFITAGGDALAVLRGAYAVLGIAP